MLPICVRPERVWPKLSSIQGITANLVYIVSLFLILKMSGKGCLSLFKYFIDIISGQLYEKLTCVCVKDVGGPGGTSGNTTRLLCWQHDVWATLAK